MSNLYCLFASVSFLSGMGTALDIGATFPEYNLSQTPEEADFKAVQSDWIAVGQDINAAIGKVEDELR
jgi:hypothetical protein